MMYAVRVHHFGGPEVLKWEQIDKPKPGPGEVLVRIEAVGVNPVDTYVRSGASGPRSFPYIPGTDGAGVVEGLGPEVDEWKVGDRVYLTGSLTGTYAQYATCQVDLLFPLPEKVSFAQGAAIYVPYSTAYRALFQRGRAKAGEWVLVHGASGGVGLAAVQWAVSRGLNVIGTAGSEAGREAVLEQGAHHVLSHRQEGYMEEVVALTGGQGPALIIEMLANLNLQKDLEIVAQHGRIVVVGNRGNLDFNPRAAMSKDADVLGLLLFNTPPEEMRDIQAAIGAGLQAGFLKPVVSRRFPLEQAHLAHQAVLEPGALGKIVLLPWV